MIETKLHIRALFQTLAPEVLLESLLQSGAAGPIPVAQEDKPLDSGCIPQRIYFQCARPLRPNHSDDELEAAYWDLSDFLRGGAPGGVFQLLTAYTDKTIRFVDGSPVFRHEKTLEWRDFSMALGQDLLVCSALAKLDLTDGLDSEMFTWPTAIHSDSVELAQLIGRKLAENHFHLNGSTQSFPLAWGFLMNHPAQARNYFSHAMFQDNLHPSVSWGEKDNQRSWPERIYLAAWLRATLLISAGMGGSSVCDNACADASCQGSTFERFLCFARDIRKRERVKKKVECLRFCRGTRFLQPNGSTKCLDYAIDINSENALKSPVRFLTGERRFLYLCLRGCYSGTFSKREADLFLLYLLLKQRFHDELIQTNKRYGFRNFAEYQDRKAHIWAKRTEYQVEAYRLAVNTSLSQSVDSLEMRISPETNSKALREKIIEPDQAIEFSFAEQAEDWQQTRESRAQEQEKYFYTLHFIKKPLPRLPRPKNDAWRIPQCRHAKLRSAVEQQAKAIAHALEHSSYLCSRVRGIDAASNEIGCRPEIFAVAFRFLQSMGPRYAGSWGQPRYWPALKATYHVGEDFRDLTDGLRAVDEAVCFLNLERGSRIGHGLALGIDPDAYYRMKNMEVILPAQDLLDNLAWLLCRSLEWGVEIRPAVRTKLKQQARQLMSTIYNAAGGQTASLLEYFESWMLRGDAPELYWDASEPPQDPVRWGLLCATGRYHGFGLNDHVWGGRDIAACRRNQTVCNLNHAYQYDPYVLQAGQEPTRFTIDAAYIQVIRRIQDCMLQKLMEKGICVECNPSSNYLIGTFRDYQKHPIFRFNNYGLDLPEYQDKHSQLHVSINTDDQGVFDTSLENEYALVYGCLTLRKDEEGHRIVSGDAALEYLEHLRIAGHSMTFPKAKKQLVT